jgi:hypothetical protein
MLTKNSYGDMRRWLPAEIDMILLQKHPPGALTDRYWYHATSLDTIQKNLFTFYPFSKC